MKLIRVSTSNELRLSLSINIKGHSRLMASNCIYQTLLSFYLFLCPNLFQPYVLFICRLHGVRGRPSWPVEARAIQRALALTGSLPSERSLDLRRATRRNRSDRISWRRCKAPSTRCPWRARVTARFCVNSEHWVHHVSLQGNCRMQINQTSWPWILGETSNKNSTASSIGTAGSCFLSSS